MTNLKTLDHMVSTQQSMRVRRQRSLPGLVAAGLLMVVAFLVFLLSGIPLVLLFFVTSVPFVISAMLVGVDIAILFLLFYLGRSPASLIVAIIGWLLVAAMAIFLSQRMAMTPPILDNNGQPVPGSISSMETVNLNGRDQWVTIRGYSEDLPVLLFLAGGPGGSELAMTRRYLGELEQHFLIVNWDQPGTGKSYQAADFASITPDQYVLDGIALTEYLRERFNESKIYLFGESWGSILGVWMAQQHPELFHAFVSTGQMVDIVENDTQMYVLAIDLLTAEGRTEAAERLRLNGAPPYDSDVLIGNFMAMNNVLNDYMAAHAYGEGTNHNLMLDSLAAPEYGLLDKLYWLLGLHDVFVTVYPQIYDLDLRTQASQLDIPVYFIQGRWDVNSSNSLLQEYHDLLEAPRKQLIWFEESAHNPSWDEPAHFVDVMVNTVLAQTQMAMPDVLMR